jgi:hypothetical protein
MAKRAAGAEAEAASLCQEDQDRQKGKEVAAKNDLTSWIMIGDLLDRRIHDREQENGTIHQENSTDRAILMDGDCRRGCRQLVDTGCFGHGSITLHGLIS